LTHFIKRRGEARLARLPVLERQQIQSDPEYFCSDAVPRRDLLRITSGGSCGAPRLVLHDPRGVCENAAHGERERTIWTAIIGRTAGYRELVVAPPHSTTLKVQQYCRERGLYPRGVGIERQYASLLDPPETTVAHINAFRPHVVHSYGSHLAILFGHLARSGASIHRPAVVTYTSDSLSPAVRTLIEQRFGIPVFTTYQAVEAFKIGFECERHCGVHLNIDLYPLRVVDRADRDLPPGESGEVIVSNLVNRGMVLLNYRLGDIVTLLRERCTCGRSLPLLSFPQGRSDDLIEFESGGVGHPPAVPGVERPEPGVSAPTQPDPPPPRHNRSRKWPRSAPVPSARWPHSGRRTRFASSSPSRWSSWGGFRRWSVRPGFISSRR